MRNTSYLFSSTRASPKPPPPPPPRSFAVPRGFTGVLITGTLFSFTLVWSIQSYRIAIQKPLPTKEEIEEVDTSSIWKNKAAIRVDGDLENTEWIAGILSKRRQMMHLASGHVLESAVGTGRNMGMYDREKVKSLTMVDQSKKMLEVAQRKWESQKPPSEIRARFLVGDLGRDEVSDTLKSEEEGSDKFDTVVETMGLCSTPDPVKMLRNLGKVVKPDGKILLLEHGKGSWDFVNNLLDHTALSHAKEHGCWWNRDIGAIVEESGLEVEEIKRSNYGTLWWLILRPAKDAASISPPETNKSSSAEGTKQSHKSSWQFWK